MRRAAARVLAAVMASAAVLAAACQQQPPADPVTDPTAATQTEERIPVGDGSGETVGYMLESDLRELPSEGGAQSGRVPVYDQETGEVIGHFEVGAEGGYEPLEE